MPLLQAQRPPRGRSRRRRARSRARPARRGARAPTSRIRRSAATERARAALDERAQALLHVLARHAAAARSGSRRAAAARLGLGERGARRRERGVHAERRLRGDRRSASAIARASCRPGATTSCTSPIRSASAASNSSPVSSQRIALRPADLAREAQRRAADRVDAALDLDLAEPRRARRDADVGREQELDADRQADALDRARRSACAGAAPVSPSGSSPPSGIVELRRSRTPAPTAADRARR